MKNDFLVELFIRNSHQIPNTNYVREYFDKHIEGKSAICEFHTFWNTQTLPPKFIFQANIASLMYCSWSWFQCRKNVGG